jgi:hypothetical protein
VLGSITPLGERSRGRNWTSTVSWYLVGSVSAGAAAGWLLGFLGSAARNTFGLPTGPTLLALASLTLAGAAVDAGLFGARLPSVHRQVNEDWLVRYRGWVYGVSFGFQLGLGVVTVVTVSAVYGVVAAAFLSGSVRVGTAIGAAFGLIRAATILATAGVREPGQLLRVDDRLRRWDRPARRLAIAAEVALAAMAVLVALK